MEETYLATYLGKEKRSDKRLRMNCTVIYRVNEPVSARFIMSGEDIKAKMIDISQGGMGMVTDYDIPIATPLSMRFTLLKVKKDVVNFSGPVEVKGEVSSNVPLEKNEHRLGIHFTTIRRIKV
jgi:c-di-GMP-binding flagellar brake protein YcgR